MGEFCTMARGSYYHRQGRVEGAQDRSKLGMAASNFELSPTMNGLEENPAFIRPSGTVIPLPVSIVLAASPTFKPLLEHTFTMPDKSGWPEILRSTSAIVLGVRKSLTSSQLLRMYFEFVSPNFFIPPPKVNGATSQSRTLKTLAIHSLSGACEKISSKTISASLFCCAYTFCGKSGSVSLIGFKAG